MNNGVTNNTQTNNTTNQTTQQTQNIPIGNLITTNNVANGTQNPNTVGTQQQPQIVATQAVPISQTQQIPTPVQQQTVTVPQQPEIKQQSEQQEEVKEEPKVEDKKEKKPNKKEKEPKKNKSGSGSLYTFLILIIIGLIGYTVYNNLNHEAIVKQLNFDCTPVSTTQKTKKLDITSTVVQDLYNKVQTNIREDLAEMELNDSMKIYLAYRQITPSKIYDSDCHQFAPTVLSGYTCVQTNKISPQAFKEETLQLELKKLFGEKTDIPNQDIQLGKACVGGYHYIEKRKEYVQGTCNNYSATSFKATKRIKEAISKNSTIIIKEEVRYYGNEQMKVPETLKSGIYIYTFKLDANYNYVYVSKEFEEKYENKES